MQYNITYREKDGGWQYIISYKDNAEKWKQKSKQGFEKSRKGKQEAKDSAEEMLEKLKKTSNSSIQLSKEHDEITFKEFIKIFIEHESIYKEKNTIITYKTSFNTFSSLNEFQMAKIKTTDIQNCIDILVKRGSMSATIRTYLININLLFKSACEKYKIIVDNPVRNIDTPREKTKNLKKALTNSELKDLLSKIKNRKYLMLSLLAAQCGLRIGELLGLTWDDIDSINCQITVRRQWKQLKNGDYGFGDLKTNNSKRIVPVSPSTINNLNKYKKDFPLNLNGRLFSYINTKSIAGDLGKAYGRAGYDISVHELRHTYATTLISNGIDFKTAAKLLGHDVEQTMKTYSHVTDDMLENASKIISSIF